MSSESMPEAKALYNFPVIICIINHKYIIFLMRLLFNQMIVWVRIIKWKSFEDERKILKWHVVLVFVGNYYEIVGM